jgi:hypothetical protein
MGGKKKYGIHCGTELPGVARFCSDCGKPQTEEEQQPPAQPTLKDIIGSADLEEIVQLCVRRAKTGPIDHAAAGLGAQVHHSLKEGPDFKGKDAILETLQAYRDALVRAYRVNGEVWRGFQSSQVRSG